jgi:prepilin-type N-terminal cleavage/methylation domain-containing protein
MLQNDQGFSLIELIVVMGMFVIVIALTGNAFDLVVSKTAQQSKVAESNIEGVLGLEIMRKDIASAGFGLPWSFSKDFSYGEAADTETLAKVYNDNGTPTKIPRAICSGNDLPNGDDMSLLIDGSDYLVVKATTVGLSRPAQLWTYMSYAGLTKPSPVLPHIWPKENLADGDKVIVVRVGLATAFTKMLMVGDDENEFYTQFNKTTGLGAEFEPTEQNISHYIYGVDEGDTLRMPFNRADYYVRRPSDENIPARCAPNTGVLYKATVNHGDGKLTELPLLDCVADMQVVYLLESASDGTIAETDASGVSGLSNEDIRQQLKAVKVFILTHEGGKDRYFTYPSDKIAVGGAGTGREYTLSSENKNYRWKVYFMTVKPENINVATQ